MSISDISGAELVEMAATQSEKLREYVRRLEAEKSELIETMDGMERGVIDLAGENVKLAQERDELRHQLAEVVSWYEATYNEAQAAGVTWQDANAAAYLVEEARKLCRRVPAEPIATSQASDPLTEIVPPVSDWPDDAVAWSIYPYGSRFHLIVTSRSGYAVNSYHYADADAMPPTGMSFAETLRLRQSPAAQPVEPSAQEEE